jgi:hypothetical protein
MTSTYRPTVVLFTPSTRAQDIRETLNNDPDAVVVAADIKAWLPDHVETLSQELDAATARGGRYSALFVTVESHPWTPSTPIDFAERFLGRHTKTGEFHYGTQGKALAHSLIEDIHAD